MKLYNNCSFFSYINIMFNTKEKQSRVKSLLYKTITTEINS